jgi:recombination protein RecT
MSEQTKSVAVKGEDRLKSLMATPSIRSRFEEMLGKRSASFMSSIVSAVNSNKALKECDPMSIISSAAVAASMDLPVNPSLGFAHIVPYKGVAQFQMGWKGFIQLAMRSGQYRTINLAPVMEGQLTKHNPFTGEMEFSAESISDKRIGYLLYFKLINGYEKYFYMTEEQCHAHAKRYSASFAKGYGRWAEDFEAMALKTVCKLGLSKYGILSLDMQKALEVDQAEIDEHGAASYVDRATDITPPQDKTKQSRLKKLMPKAETVSQVETPVPDSKQEEVSDDIPL